MSVFKFPKELCEDIQSIINKFWWGHTSMDSRKILLVGKDRLCKWKLDGGLGCRNLDVFNTTLLARQFWRILNSKGSLVWRLLKAV